MWRLNQQRLVFAQCASDSTTLVLWARFDPPHKSPACETIVIYKATFWCILVSPPLPSFLGATSLAILSCRNGNHHLLSPQHATVSTPGTKCP